MDHNLEYFGYSIIQQFVIVLHISYILSHADSQHFQQVGQDR